ncbi:hypothetical protein WH50_14275 [Pokkaliibacter plantistimulans]|uniref:Ferredoxin n=1 Tax=Pokkaliibacter plantistimulans TaxID=1635171 RepID=A0ABX5LWL9_9GAMM|nr:2Fe-2S iron-sulfur cluster-binding protein [Pokkaliibacter plantistimulans]PXF30602.1 hypothetical protein WH50_14275 [Pokkaliibacter plantistimulans]
MPTVQARCESSSLKTDDVRLFRLKLENSPVRQTISAGQHVTLVYPDLQGRPQRRLYSVVRTTGADTIEIAVQRTGKQGLSDSLHATLRAGSVLAVEGVSGNITVDRIKDARQVLMVAAGIGITLPMALLNALAERDDAGLPVPAIRLILCAPYVVSIPFLHELLQLSLTRRWFHFDVYITRELILSHSQFHSGRPTAAAFELEQTPETVIACGGFAFAHAIREHISQRYPDSQLLLEAFTAPTRDEPSAQSANKDSEDSGITLQLTRSERHVSADPSLSLLDNLQLHGIPIKSQCRSGICGSCRVHVSGEVHREPDFCLDEKDKAQGYALACCTFPRAGHIIVDPGISH